MSQRPYVTVREVMTANPIVIDGLATVREAMDIMRRENFSSLVVARRHENDAFGLVVVRDIAEHVVGPDRSPDRTSVYEVMAKPALSLDAELDIKYAARLLTSLKMTRAVVLEKGELIGLVTLRDLVFRYIPSS
ncbi:MAG: CBS domain-containing protein [Thermoleophilia bacterium]|nr:CBS domain-containing protein [Thermoleophilia bacterium]MDH4340879.1 CBS domain-containing protein [Thermoleophilia bacterium]MDH5282213.1 CBS domain-containing protein [Thermoleophilia bacterium]